MKVNKSNLRCVGWEGLFCLLILAIASNGVYGQASVNREHEPVVISGSQLPDFAGFPISFIHVYAYRADKDEWQPIPFQIDEKEDSTMYSYFASHAGLLSNFDELVFMAKDMGDQAPDASSWPADDESRMNMRYEISATDAYTGGQAYAYIYLSSALGNALDSYVTENNGRVYGQTYGMGHDPNVASGLPDSLAISQAAGGDGTDFLYKQRMRLSVELKSSGITIVLELKEKMDQDVFGVRIRVFQKRAADKVVGPVRVLRQVIFGMTANGSFFGQQVNFEDSLKLIYSYYSAFSEQSSGAREIPTINPGGGVDARVSSLYLTNAHHSNVIGMDYYSAEHTEGRTITDGSSPISYEQAVQWPGVNWYAMVAKPVLGTVGVGGGAAINHGSVITLVDLRGDPIVNRPFLDFHTYDNADGSRYYGIMGLGMQATGSSQFQGVFDMVSRSFYFGQNFNLTEIQNFVAQYSVPLNLSLSTASFPDQGPPAKVADLMVSSVSDTTATLKWTAVGDDGNGMGPAKSYILRYSDVPLDPAQWWVWWGIANTVLNVPTPSAPGEQDSVTVKDLVKNTTYYFAIRVLDDQDNASDISDAATATTTPVELGTFIAVADRNQVRLNWTTLSETNNFGFELQRRAEGQLDWIELGFIDGAGTTNEPQNYNYSDRIDEYGTYYYRLRQIDTDGAFHFSNSIQVNVAAPSKFALYQNYPNPFSSAQLSTDELQTTIAFEVPDGFSGQVELKIFDVLGRKVRTLVNQNLRPGFHQIAWDGVDDTGRRVGAGVYMYVLSSNNFTQVRKMLVMQ